MTQKPNYKFAKEWELVSFEEQRSFFINISCVTKNMINEKIECPLVFPTGYDQSLKISHCNSQSEQTKMKALVSLKRNFPVELTPMTEPSSHQGWVTKSARQLRSILVCDSCRFWFVRASSEAKHQSQPSYRASCCAQSCQHTSLPACQAHVAPTQNPARVRTVKLLAVIGLAKCFNDTLWE